LTPIGLRRVVAVTEGDVMDCACSHAAPTRCRIEFDVDEAAKCVSFGCEADKAFFFGDFAEAHDAEQFLGVFEAALKQRDSVKTLNRLRPFDIRVARSGSGMRDALLPARQAR